MKLALAILMLALAGCTHVDPATGEDVTTCRFCKAVYDAQGRPVRYDCPWNKPAAEATDAQRSQAGQCGRPGPSAGLAAEGLLAAVAGRDLSRASGSEPALAPLPAMPPMPKMPRMP